MFIYIQIYRNDIVFIDCGGASIAKLCPANTWEYAINWLFDIGFFIWID